MYLIIGNISWQQKQWRKMNTYLAIVLNGRIKNDSRVIKVIRSLSKYYFVDLFYINGNKDEDKNIFNNRVRLFTYNHPVGFIRKILRHSFFFWEYNYIYKEIIKNNQKYDVVYCNDLPTLNVGIKYKKTFGTKLIYDSHEIYIETINQFYTKDKNILKNQLFNISTAVMQKSGRLFEKIAIKLADKVITVNESLSAYFLQEYDLKSPPHVIMNYPYFYNSKTKKDINFIKSFNWKDDAFILLYQGNLNKGRGLELIIDVIVRLPENFKLIIIGDGILSKNLKKKVNDLTLSNRVIFMGKINNEILLNYTSAVDIGINLLENLNKSKAMASPNKLFEYLQAEIPSINTNTIENKKVISKYSNGWLVENDKSKIIELLLSINEDQVKVIKKNCHNAKEELSWENQEKKLFSLIKT